jgi:hypothetical protein
LCENPSIPHTDEAVKNADTTRLKAGSVCFFSQLRKWVDVSCPAYNDGNLLLNPTHGGRVGLFKFGLQNDANLFLNSTHGEWVDCSSPAFVVPDWRKND